MGGSGTLPFLSLSLPAAISRAISSVTKMCYLTGDNTEEPEKGTSGRVGKRKRTRPEGEFAQHTHIFLCVSVYILCII